MSRKYKKGKSMGILAVASILFSSAIICQPIICREMRELKLVPEDEHFTELYFEDYAGLFEKPDEEKIDSFSFTIGNSEGADKEYPYIVYLENGTDKTVIDLGKVSVNDHGSKTVSESYAFKTDHSAEILYVELPEQKQKIHLSLTNNK